ncbi:uncharacterized protein PAC_16666 [Phialocephala subalpina]|uniref:C2H2-type domain-containing protein n=1 Tax=Phialocephala subalpina TaxID=576137 RepID=A0A1L7XNZ2_9HELO|nr:uncharacterized protein PAC_16666 [Phialocephala subalpina]
MTYRKNNKPTGNANADVAPKKTIAEARWAAPQVTRYVAYRKNNKPTGNANADVAPKKTIAEARWAAPQVTRYGLGRTKSQDNFVCANGACTNTFSNLKDLDAHVVQVHNGTSSVGEDKEQNEVQLATVDQDYEEETTLRADLAYVTYCQQLSPEERERLLDAYAMLDLPSQEEWITAYPGPLDYNRQDEIWFVIAWLTSADKGKVNETIADKTGRNETTNEGGEWEYFRCDVDFGGKAFPSLVDLNKHIVTDHPHINGENFAWSFSSTIPKSIINVCPFQPCTESFATKEELNAHHKAHRNALIKAMAAKRLFTLEKLDQHPTTITQHPVTSSSEMQRDQPCDTSSAEVTEQQTEVQRDQSCDNSGSALATRLDLDVHNNRDNTTASNHKDTFHSTAATSLDLDVNKNRDQLLDTKPKDTPQIDNYACQIGSCKKVYATRNERVAHIKADHQNCLHKWPTSCATAQIPSKTTNAANDNRESVHLDASKNGDNGTAGEEDIKGGEGDVVVVIVERTEGMNIVEGASNVGTDTAAPGIGDATNWAVKESAKLTGGTEVKEGTKTKQSTKAMQNVKVVEVIDSEEMKDYEAIDGSKAARGKKTSRDKGTTTDKKVKGGKRLAGDDAEETSKAPKIVKVKKLADGEEVEFLDPEEGIIQRAPEDDFMDRMRKIYLEKKIPELKAKLAALKRNGAPLEEYFECQREILKAKNDFHDINTPTSCARGLSP